MQDTGGGSVMEKVAVYHRANKEGGVGRLGVGVYVMREESVWV